VYPWAFYRPWGFGPFFPLFFLAFWFFVLRIFLQGWSVAPRVARYI
jgi:hypothetical protein